MATGYTYPVQDGEINTFAEFAASCARAFGANIMLRDEPADIDIPVYQLEEYYTKNLQKSVARLDEVSRWTVTEAAEKAAEAYWEAIQHNDKAAKENELHNARLQDMLDEVIMWTPPTEDHVGLKEFMVQQLEDSIKWNVHYEREIVRQTGAEFKEHAIDMARKDVEYFTEELVKEQARIDGRNAWNRALFDSLVKGD